MSDHCEWCVTPAKWRVRVSADYVRYACADHIAKVRRLIALDHSQPMTYEFEPVEESARG